MRIELVGTLLNLDPAAVLSSLMHTRPSTAIRESTWAIMALEAVHLIGLTLLGGPAITIGLSAMRRTGLRGLSVSVLATALLPVLGVGLLLMALSGTLIAISMPFKYYMNVAFRWKMLLLALALMASALLLQSSRAAPIRRSTHLRQRFLALASLLLWFCVGFSGRLIGFL